MTPFWANQHYHLPMQFKPPKAPSNLRLEILVDPTAAGIKETHRLLWDTLLDARVQQSKYPGGKDVTFGVGNKVWLSTWHFQSTRLSQKLDYKCTGRNMVSKVINTNAYELDLPKTIRNHNVFDVLLLDHYTPPVARPPCSEAPLVFVDDSKEWEVERILDSKPLYGKLHYLIQWAGYSHIRTSWKRLRNLENSHELIDEFHRDHTKQLWRWKKPDLGSGGIDGMEIWRLRSFGHFLLSISFCWDRVQYKWRRHGFYLLQKSSQLEVEFPQAPEGHPGRYCSIVGLMRSYECVCRLFPCFLLVLSSPGVLP